MNPTFKIEVVQAFKLPDGSTHTNMEDAAWYLIASTVGGVLGSPETAESMLAQSTAQPTVKPRIVELLAQLRALFQVTDVTKPTRNRAPKAVATPVTPAVLPVSTGVAASTPVPVLPVAPVADAPVKRKPGRQPGFKVKPKEGKVAKVVKVAKTKAAKPVVLPAAIVPPVPAATVPPVPAAPPLPTDIPPLPAGLPPVPPPVFSENTPL
jgi:hypothetical protein